MLGIFIVLLAYLAHQIYTSCHYVTALCKYNKKLKERAAVKKAVIKKKRKDADDKSSRWWWEDIILKVKKFIGLTRGQDRQHQCRLYTQNFIKSQIRIAQPSRKTIWQYLLKSNKYFRSNNFTPWCYVPIKMIVRSPQNDPCKNVRANIVHTANTPGTPVSINNRMDKHILAYHIFDCNCMTMKSICLTLIVANMVESSKIRSSR